MSRLLWILTGPLLMPAKLLRVLSPAASVKGLPCISCPPMKTLTVACWFVVLANRSWVSRSTLLYHGSQYVVSRRLFGRPIISMKLVLTPLTL